MQYGERLRRVRQAMEQRDIDLLFLTPSANMQYLTGIERDRPNYGNVQYPGGWVHGALIGHTRGPIILAPRMVAEFDMSPDVADVRVLPDQGDSISFMAGVLGEFGPLRRVALENRAWADTLLHLQRLLPDAAWSPASEVMAPLRMIKDEEEIAVMRHASQLADTVMDGILPGLRVGMSELDVALEVDTQMIRLGSTGPSFTTNVFTFGPHEARELREKAGARRLLPGVSLSFDFGCVHEGYCSDFGRTVHFGEPTAEFRLAYQAVIAAHDAAIRQMKADAITAEQANAVARAVIDDAGYGAYFLHRLGHGIGLDVHEGPFLTVGDTTVLRTGMAFTVEPSIYWVGRMGLRIEDVVIVRPDGAEVLNEASSALRVVAC